MRTLTYKVKVDEEVDVILFENASTGYRWGFPKEVGPVKIIRIEVQNLPDRDQVGGGYDKRFVFRCEQPGEYVIHGVYTRSWINNADPADQVLLHFIVEAV